MPRARLGTLASAILMLSACPNMELAALNPCTVSSASIRVDTGGVSDVDLLFIIDNSGSMATEQVKLAAQLPQLVNVLVNGDRYYGRTPPDGVEDEDRLFTPVRSLHLGVVSTSMGGREPGSREAPNVQDCAGLGDDGVLLNSTVVAVDGLYVESWEANKDNPEGKEILAPLPGCDAIGDQPPYQNYESGGELSAEDLVQNFSCVARLGTRGCPFEQQLEAMWKAVAPSNGKDPELHEFLDGTHGHGSPNGRNENFVRENAILAVIQISDEEDCSITEAGKELIAYGDEAEEKYGDLNLRCGKYANEGGFLWPAERYARGLRSLKPDNEDLIVYGAIVGIPIGTGNDDPDSILALDEMQFAVGTGGLPRQSCVSAQGDVAYPPRRFLEVAKAFGDDAVLHSICDDSFAPALDRLIERIASKLSGNCLPQPLVRDEDGQVRCDVFEMLPPGVKECDPKHGHDGKPSTRQVTENNKASERTVCHMQQVAVVAGQPEQGEIGWYYDDFDPKLKDECKNDPQRISFSFGQLASGGGAFIECFRPVPRIEENSRGRDAVNIGCEGNAEICGQRSDDNYTLFCTPDNTCQIECEKTPECPLGWVCGSKAGEGDGPKYCQIPTCPVDDN
jgi:hypothetical protein